MPAKANIAATINLLKTKTCSYPLSLIIYMYTEVINHAKISAWIRNNLRARNINEIKQTVETLFWKASLL